MTNIKDYIASGILELYVLGVATNEENEELQSLLLIHPELKEELNIISETIEAYAIENALSVDPTIKPFLLAQIDYTERLKNGEQPAFPAILNKNSNISDYSQWINRPDMNLPENFEDFHAKIIGYTPEAITAIIWIKQMAPQEVHKDEFEKFLILEGTCDLTIEDEVHNLKAGDYLAIPLFKKHDLKITSSIPCKAILQRIAA